MCITLQDITVRKLYKEARSAVKKAWEFTNAIHLYVVGTTPSAKDDQKIRDVGIHDSITLSVFALTVPDTWDIFVTVPGMSAPIRITMEEVLYMYVFSDKYNHDNNMLQSQL